MHIWKLKHACFVQEVNGLDLGTSLLELHLDYHDKDRYEGKPSVKGITAELLVRCTLSRAFLCAVSLCVIYQLWQEFFIHVYYFDYRL